MKHIKNFKTFENWTTNSTGNYNINYGDNPQKPQLSDIVIDTIKYIEDNYNNIQENILNDVKPDQITFKSGLKYQQIRLQRENEEHNNIPILIFKFYEYNVDSFYYSNDITEDDYKYLKDYFYKIYLQIRKKVQDRKKQEFIDQFNKVETEKALKAGKKFNV